MFQFGDAVSPSVFVAGGLTYNEFEKFVEVRKSSRAVSVKLFAEDPVGKRVKPNSDYLSNDRFYVCYNNENPFEALEKYGLALRKAQKINLSYYDFPTVCLWYASHYNKNKSRSKFNDTKGAVREMDYAIKSGITKFTRVAIRLVPDAYGKNNQQGWWDDKHWAMYGEKMSTEKAHYVEPYLSSESWMQAIAEKGGIPITYFQGSRRSEDFVKLHPDYMLFNDPHRLMTGYPENLLKYVDISKDAGLRYTRHWWLDKPFCSNPMFSYDYTDKGFIKHLKGVYQNLSDAGVKGIMYDYPEMTSWAYEGGFDDKYTTTSAAYRMMYQIPYEMLGKDSYLDERNLARGSDITLGLVASQRVWADTDNFYPEMVNRSGLRWYKNRVVVNYDLDAKDPDGIKPTKNLEGLKTMATMCYVLSGRFLMGRSFEQLSEKQISVVARTFPYHNIPRSARPIDAFTTSYTIPRIFDFEVTPDWHQLTFYNDKKNSSVVLDVVPGGSLNNGGLGMDIKNEYHIYDFWNDTYVSKVRGSGTLTQNLRPGETRMMSIHTVQKNPQFISTNRHIMQGMVDLSNCTWNDKKKVLSATSKVVENDSYIIVVAKNGYKAIDASVSFGNCTLVEMDNDLLKLVIESQENKEIDWQIKFN